MEKTYNAYLDEVIHSIGSNLFNVLGHLDVIRKCFDDRIFEPKNLDHEDCIGTILEEIRTRKMYLEINSKSSLIREKCTDALPSKETVVAFVQNGGKLISLGSDAHSAEEVGSGIREMLNFLEDLDGNKFKLLFE